MQIKSSPPTFKPNRILSSSVWQLTKMIGPCVSSRICLHRLYPHPSPRLMSSRIIRAVFSRINSRYSSTPDTAATFIPERLKYLQVFSANGASSSIIRQSYTNLSASFLYPCYSAFMRVEGTIFLTFHAEINAVRHPAASMHRISAAIHTMGKRKEIR